MRETRLPTGGGSLVFLFGGYCEDFSFVIYYTCTHGNSGACGITDAAFCDVNLRFSKLHLPSVYIFHAKCYNEHIKFHKEKMMMSNQSMGEKISTLRKEKGMTQRELADLLNITDKAVSKWERDVCCPDTLTIPKLAEILGVSVEELMQAKAVPSTGHRGAGYLVQQILRAIPLAMGVAVVVLSLLGELDLRSGFIFLGIGMICFGLSAYLFDRKE